MSFIPVYAQSLQNGRLDEKITVARDRLRRCNLCPRSCGIDRTVEKTGVCRTGDRAVVYSFAPHFGEENPLVGRCGSGTIFFSNCNLRCVFCQNSDISLRGRGREVCDHELADMMLALQARGCHNINLVTPSHVVPQILSAVRIAALRGLRIPLVYNTSAYDSLETLSLLDGVIDIYMPDFKFWEPAVARRFTRAEDYPAKARAAIKEMHRQVGDLILDDRGVALRGLLVRHLVLPQGLAGTAPIMQFLAHDISTQTYVNIMQQYRPYGKARSMAGIHRPVTSGEFAQAIAVARQHGLRRLDGQIAKPNFF